MTEEKTVLIKKNVPLNIPTIPPFKPIPNRSDINKMDKLMSIINVTPNVSYFQPSSLFTLPLSLPLPQHKHHDSINRRKDNLGISSIKSPPIPITVPKRASNLTPTNSSINILESAIMSHQQQMQYDQFNVALNKSSNLTPSSIRLLIPTSTSISISKPISTSTENVTRQQPQLEPEPEPQSNSHTSVLNVPSHFVNLISSIAEQNDRVISRKNFLNNPSNVNVIMNAPREYYPFGYDKNFDDNFTSRIELPKSTFQCGNQKHFPGLYANEQFGCMVCLFFFKMGSKYDILTT